MGSVLPCDNYARRPLCPVWDPGNEPDYRAGVPGVSSFGDSSSTTGQVLDLPHAPSSFREDGQIATRFRSLGSGFYLLVPTVYLLRR